MRRVTRCGAVVIDLPPPHSRVGRRVKWRGTQGLERTGLIVRVQRETVVVRPDFGTKRALEFPHTDVVALSQRLPPRPESELVAEIARCYARVEARWHRDQIATNVRRAVKRRLRQLLGELGRDVTAEEAFAMHFGEASTHDA